MSPKVLDWSKLTQREFMVDVAFIETPKHGFHPYLAQVRYEGLPLQVKRPGYDLDIAVIFEGPTAHGSGFGPVVEETITLQMIRFVEESQLVEYDRRVVKSYLTFGLKAIYSPEDSRVWRVDFDEQVFERFPYDMPVTYSSDGYDIPIMRFSQAILAVTDPNPKDVRLPDAGPHHDRWCHIQGVEPMSLQDPQYQIEYPYWH